MLATWEKQITHGSRLGIAGYIRSGFSNEKVDWKKSKPIPVIICLLELVGQHALSITGRKKVSQEQISCPGK
jgi:hypothetical protein